MLLPRRKANSTKKRGSMIWRASEPRSDPPRMPALNFLEKHARARARGILGISECTCFQDCLI
jgi:hypothetical protein